MVRRGGASAPGSRHLTGGVVRALLTWCFILQLRPAGAFTAPPGSEALRRPSIFPSFAASAHRGVAPTLSMSTETRATGRTVALKDKEGEGMPSPSTAASAAGSPSNELGWFFKSIGQHSLLRAEEEVLLARKVQAMIGWEDVRDGLKDQLGRPPTLEEWASSVGMQPDELRRKLLRGQSAKKAMISSNLRLVISIAKRYQKRGLALTDLIQEGSLGLVRAVEKFDPEKGFKFSTYSTWWIKQAILRAIADQSRTIRLPVHIHDLLNTMKKQTRELHVSLGRNPTNEEIAERMNLPIEKLRFLQECSRPAVSMDAQRRAMTKKSSSAGKGGEVQLGDSIKDDGPCPTQVTEANMLKEDIEKLVCTLSPREQDVIRMRFGLDADKPKTLEEIGNVFSVTRERVRQIEARALHKLRQPYRNHKLREYAGQDSQDASLRDDEWHER